jgi:hypothetical protein
MSLLQDAVNGVGLDLIDSQLELDDYMPQWLEETYDHDLDEAGNLDWTEVMLRAVVLNAKAAAKELKEKYGIEDASDFPDD